MLPAQEFYRVANVQHCNGLWYNRDGVFTGRIHKEFNFCKNHELQMPYDESIVGWLSATDTLESLLFWFNPEDITKLRQHGYDVYKYTSTQHRFYANHWLIHPDGIIDTVHMKDFG
jgi:hypothetical protein